MHVYTFIGVVVSLAGYTCSLDLLVVADVFKLGHCLQTWSP